MHTNFFFNGSWIAQIFVGFGLFACSFFVEYTVLIHFVSPPFMALFLAITLEGGKITAIVWHYYLGYLAEGTYPATIRLTSLIFRFGLVSLSLICSMLFFTSHLDRPNMDAVKEKQMTEVETQIAQETTLTKNRLEEKWRHLFKSQQVELQGLRSRYDTRISKLEALLLTEMNNVVNGIFKGSRYEEFERRLDKEKQARDSMIIEMQKRHEQQLTTLDKSNNTVLSDLQTRAAERRKNIRNDDFSNDERAHDKRIVALLKTVESISDWIVLPLQFVFFFSILISMLMEAGIMLSFATITVAIAPVLHARHVEELEKEACRVRAESTARQDKMRHNAAVNRVRKAGKRIVEVADTIYGHAVSNPV